MVVVDSSPGSHAAIVEGIALARVDAAEVVFFHVLPRYPVPMVDEVLWAAQSEAEFDRAARAQGQRHLCAAAAIADKAGVMHRSAVAQGPDAAACIAQAAVNRRCDLVVVASEGRNAVVRLMTGSVIPGLISSSTIPVMVCRGGIDSNADHVTATTRRRPGVYRNVMIVVECREGAWAAVSQGLDLAQRHGATATLALAVPPFTDVIVTMPGLPVISNDAAALELARYGAQLLDRSRSEARRQGVPSRTVAIDELDVATGVAKCAREEGSDVIIVACEPVNAVVRLFNGSLVPGLVTAATVPVVICHDKAQTAPPRRRRTRLRQVSRRGGAGGSPTLPPS
jgi:nucleotide-binding universal stress UspA family protein